MTTSQTVSTSLARAARFVAIATAGLAAFGGTALADSSSETLAPAASTARDTRPAPLAARHAPTAQPVRLAPASKLQTTVVLAADDQAYADAMTAAFSWVDIGNPTAPSFAIADHTRAVAELATTAFSWVDTSAAVNNRYVHPVDDAQLADAATTAFSWIDVR